MQKIAVLYDASRAVLSTFNVDEVLERILAVPRDHFQIQNASVFLVDPISQKLIVRGHIGKELPPREQLVEPGQGIPGTAAQQKRPLYISDLKPASREGQRGSELALPLMVQDEVLGVLDLQSDQPNAFDQEALDLLALFSSQASIALENARRYNIEQRRAAQLEAINVIARQTTAVLEIDELLRKVCRLVLDHFVLDNVAILLLEETGLRLRAHDGRLTPAVPPGITISRSTSLAVAALRTSRAMLENDVSKIPKFQPMFSETRSEICIPLIFFGEKLGVMVLDSAKAHNFLKDDVPSLQSVADIIAGAIQNTNYFERARQLAYIDGLTGIFNRRFFELRIAEELERAIRYDGQITVIMIDIDHFKQLNDEFGHLLGDEVLRQVSSIFQQQLRKGDVVCRYGGEEFVVVVPQTSPESAFEVADKLRRIVEAWHFPGVPRRVTISAGLAGFPLHGRTRDEIVAAADAALYAAKQAGRNQVVAAGAEPRIASNI